MVKNLVEYLINNLSYLSERQIDDVYKRLSIEEKEQVDREVISLVIQKSEIEREREKYRR
ncbi:hypothetical protein K7P65_002774 [Enterococcus faecalis]|uniref:hypothetical protein n=1 Tax=Enterococcus faecalis TaxID=1351 RepID=UPI00115E88DB|nr:hypothetical protein [Enterococcus faecalis]EGO5830008.1 hypothetical protein [Enterococcus faecalis]EGO8860046.1 hypothetical protein [Enterococcus faecalis]EHH1657659.1 hypothetical protein [Enterococcus faecalis]EIA6415145.1 hypothetical protein [Enterococcus faecalis]